MWLLKEPFEPEVSEVPMTPGEEGKVPGRIDLVCWALSFMLLPGAPVCSSRSPQGEKGILENRAWTRDHLGLQRAGL